MPLHNDIENAGQNKLDVHLRRELDYQLRVDNGRVEATVTVTLHNDLGDFDLTVQVSYGGLTGEAAEKNMRLFVEKVLPELQSRG